MKVKNRSVCQTCRARKLGCDGKHPACTQCVHSGRACDGYQTSWQFVASSRPTPTSKQRQKKHNQLCYKLSSFSRGTAQRSSRDDSASLLNLEASFLRQPSQDEFEALVVRNYVPQNTALFTENGCSTTQPRICGAWVEVLPKLRSTRDTPDLVLTTAVKALGTSILTQKLHPTKNDLESCKSYESALRSLRRSFASQHRFDTQLLASIMCLSLVELMMPSTSAALDTHLKGAGHVFQAYGAGACSRGVLHTLFAGFRPLLILKAFQLRQQTFLASPAWTHIPFSKFSASTMQSLLNRASIIPSLLSQSDELLNESFQCSIDAKINDLYQRFVDALIDLENWETENCQKSDRCCHGPYKSSVSPIHENSLSDSKPLSFTNVTMANVYTNLWAFRIICFSELERLAKHMPPINLMPEEICVSIPIDFKHIHAYKTSLAKKICLSMDYLLRDEMGLFGPASTFFPLQVAYEAFLGDPGMQMEGATFVDSVVQRLVQKGLRSAPVLVYSRSTIRV